MKALPNFQQLARARILLVTLIAVTALGPGIPSHARQRMPDPAASSIVARIETGGAPWRLGIGEGAVWVLDREGDVVRRIDPATNRVVGPPIRLPFDPWDLAVGEGGVWVTSNGDPGVVARIDPETHTVVATIGGDPEILGAYVTAGEGGVWVGNSDERAPGDGTTVSLIDPATNRLSGHIPIPGSPQALVAGDGAVWVGNHNASTVGRIDPPTARVVAVVPVVSDPHAIAVDEGRVWVANTHTKQLTQIDSATNTVVGEPIVLDFEPIHLAATVGGVWVSPKPPDQATALTDDRVVRVDMATRRVTASIHTGALPTDVAADEGTTWVAVQSPGAVVRIESRPALTAMPDRG